MKTSTRVLLVMLRLAIGWHLLFSAVEKVRKDSWSSEGYLREATGPPGPTFRELAGDEVLAQLTLRPIPDGTDLTREPLHKYFSPELEGDWKAYYDQFVTFYHLNDEANTKFRDLAEKKYAQQKEQTARWLITGTEAVEFTGPDGKTKKVEMTMPERLALYQEWKKTSPADAAKLRKALSNDLNKQSAQMQKALHEALPPSLPEQYGDLKAGTGSRWKHYERWREWTLLDWTNALVVVGLGLSGAMLLLGLFTRLGCVLGALMLLMFYLPAIPLPGIPESLRNEGYPFINKNLVEMLALLTLATTPSGKWLGFDGLVQFLNPFNYRRQPPPVEKRGPHVAEMAAAGAPRITPTRREF